MVQLSGVGRIVVASLFGTSIVWSGQACAEGALAVGIPSNVSQQGTSYGISYNQPTADAASSVALQNCKNWEAGSASAKPLCNVVSTFSNKCAAVSEDPQAGTPGYGWAIAGDLQTAENQALGSCRATAGESRRSFCAVSMFECDGSAH